MKKLKLLIVAILLAGISANVSAGIFRGKGSSAGLKKIITILVAMQAKQALMETELGKELIEAVNQTQNQLKQIEYDGFRKRTYDRTIDENTTRLSRIDEYSKSI